MNITELVPPFELCEKIPAGEFEDSALVWVKSDPAVCTHCTGQWHVSLRDAVELPACNKWYPAPVLNEILSKLGEYAKAEHYSQDGWECDEF